MTTLAEDIEALRLRMVETIEEEAAIVDTLGQRMHEADMKVMRAVEQLLVDQELRRRNISHLIATLAARVGHVPRLTTPPPLPKLTMPADEYEAGEQDDPQSSARASANHYANAAGVH